MKIGCLQFAPRVGDVDNNLNRADAILNRANPEDLDLLVLPELAFTGYNFKSLRDISPFFENTGSGITSVWARTTALKHNCKVVVGYPETADVAYKWPTSPEYYNSAIIVNEDGETCGRYRKTHLYYTDETWALEGSGFFKRYVPGIGKVAMGICMDIKFEAPWAAYEFASHALDVSANVVILSMAWLTREDAASFSCRPKEPDMETLTYWIKRLEPIIRRDSEEEIIVIFANRTGIEDDAVYAGTSAVIGIKNGEVTVYGLLGRGEKELLVVDTSKPGFAKLVYRPEEEEEEAQSVEAPGGEPQMPPGDTATPVEGSPNSSDISLSSRSEIDGAVPRGPDPTSMSREQAGDGTKRRSFYGHFLIDSDALSNCVADSAHSGFEKPTPSPRYFGDEPVTWPKVVSQSPTLGNLGDFVEWPSPRHPSPQDQKQLFSADTPDSGQPESGSREEFSSLKISLREPNLDAEASNDRPSSTRSRNAGNSRPQTPIYTPESERPLARPLGPSVKRQDHYGDVNRGEARPRSKSRTSDFHSPSRAEKPGAPGWPDDPMPERHYNTMSPDLEKLDADLMVFEEETANRIKRDSLVCHVDEDDFVVLRKDDVDRRKTTKPDVDASYAASYTTPRSYDRALLDGARYHEPSRGCVESPTQHVREGDSIRTLSQGRHRTNSSSTPKSLSKKTSCGHVNSGISLPLAHDPVDRPAIETYYQPKHHQQSLGISNMSSSSSRRRRRAPPGLGSLHSMPKSPELTAEEKEATIMNWTASHRMTGPHDRYLEDKSIISMSDIPIMMAPDEPEPNSLVSPSATSSLAKSLVTNMTTPDHVAVEGALPPTPKAMVLPRDPSPNRDSGGAEGSSGGPRHQSAPIPPKKTQTKSSRGLPLPPLQCSNDKQRNVDIAGADRPRSAVW